MLVLTRKPGESLVIGGKATLRVLGIDGDRVKIGIEAPRDVTILRQELCEEVTSANLQAAMPAQDLRALLPSLKRHLVAPAAPHLDSLVENDK